MPVNIFGAPLERVGAAGTFHASADALRGYVRDNALCLNRFDYDARERKIRRVVAPENDTDAANKSYVELMLRGVREESRAFCDKTTNEIAQLRSVLDQKTAIIHGILSIQEHEINVAKEYRQKVDEEIEKSTAREREIRTANDERRHLREAVERLREDANELKSNIVRSHEREIQRDNDERRHLKEAVDKLREDANELKSKIAQLASEIQPKRPHTRSRSTQRENKKKDKDKDREKDTDTDTDSMHPTRVSA